MSGLQNEAVGTVDLVTETGVEIETGGIEVPNVAKEGGAGVVVAAAAGTVLVIAAGAQVVREDVPGIRIATATSKPRELCFQLQPRNRAVESRKTTRPFSCGCSQEI